MGTVLQFQLRTEVKVSEAMDKDQERLYFAQMLEKVAESQDRSAFEALFKHFGPLIKSFAVSSNLHFQGDHLPEELVQDVMMTIWRKAPLYDAKKAAPSTWIFTIARNQRINILRKLNKYRSDLNADDVWELESEEDLFSDVRVSRIQQQVNEQLYTLPVDQKQIISKVFLEDKSHQQVADELGLPLGTVKSRVRLAMQKLKLTLGANEL
ncbi:sigma-70 family RNA polymerase sigma factor [Reinekea sp.]|jgi:RNA polymerase sigma-70 factor (ECF subfamily)|uniref:sigma-70 family RNA polymerase sigma factor n=1 Tax=Reinekea sp. TaxID=1970455 RepID=UPI003989CEBA